MGSGLLQFGGNLGGGGDPRVYGELSEQASVLKSLSSAARGPGTRFAGREIDVAFEGPTF